VSHCVLWEPAGRGETGTEKIQVKPHYFLITFAKVEGRGIFIWGAEAEMSLWFCLVTAQPTVAPGRCGTRVFFPFLSCNDPLIKVFKANYHRVSFYQSVGWANPLPTLWMGEEKGNAFQSGPRNSVLMDLPGFVWCILQQTQNEG
jgi:hypothetical protein